MISVRFKNIVWQGKRKINIEWNVKTEPVEIMVEGHAGAGVRDTDIVCAAVSALTQTALLAVQQVAMIKQSIVQKTGYLRSVIDIGSATPDRLTALKIILSTLLLGLEKIKDEHAQRIKLYFE